MIFILVRKDIDVLNFTKLKRKYSFSYCKLYYCIKVVGE